MKAKPEFGAEPIIQELTNLLRFPHQDHSNPSYRSDGSVGWYTAGTSPGGAKSAGADGRQYYQRSHRRLQLADELLRYSCLTAQP